MAKRRCISIDFYENENFLALNDKTKVLYTMLLLHCDDEGIIINPTTVTKMTGASKRNIITLIEKGFILDVDGVLVLTHWYLHNTIQPSKRNNSIYVNVIEKLKVNSHKEYEVVSGKKSENIRPNITKPNSSQFNTTQVNTNKINETEPEDNLNRSEENESPFGTASREEILGMSAEEIARTFDRYR